MVKIKKWYLNLIGIVIFIIILTRLNISEVFKILKQINIFYFVVASFFLVFLILIKLMRWIYLLKTQEIVYPFKDAFLMYSSGLYVGLVTPGRVGEITKLLYLKKDGHSFGKSFFSVFLERLSDFLFLILFGYIGMFFFLSLFRRFVNWLFYFLIVCLIITILVTRKRYFIRKILRKIFRMFIPEKYKEKVRMSFYDFYNDLKKLSKKNLLIIVLLTFFSWFVYYVQMYLLANAIGIDISFVYLAICVTISAVITLIPISISGIGTRDVTLITLFSFLGINKEYAIAMSLLILFMSIFAALIGLVCWFKKPLGFGY